MEAEDDRPPTAWRTLAYPRTRPAGRRHFDAGMPWQYRSEDHGSRSISVSLPTDDGALNREESSGGRRSYARPSVLPGGDLRRRALRSHGAERSQDGTPAGSLPLIGCDRRCPPGAARAISSLKATVFRGRPRDVKVTGVDNDDDRGPLGRPAGPERPRLWPPTLPTSARAPNSFYECARRLAQVGVGFPGKAEEDRTVPCARRVARDDLHPAEPLVAPARRRLSASGETRPRSARGGTRSSRLSLPRDVRRDLHHAPILAGDVPAGVAGEGHVEGRAVDRAEDPVACTSWPPSG